MKLPRVPRVFLSRAVRVPAVFGLFRPTVLIPEERFEPMSQEDLRNSPLHEMAHLKRRDLTLLYLP